jgi:NAD(P)-dependent dehydrogenase (short-subunit alcohol dehydrogenase family)
MTALSGEAVVITGAGAGIGAACARAAGAAQAQVVVNDINTAAAEAVAAQIRAAGGRAVAQPGDVSRPESAEALVKRCIAEFGFISGLVNNAGICLWGQLEEANFEDVRRMIEVNVFGVFNCARAAVGPMLSRGRGSIVNITSGAQAGMKALGAYGASKGAIASFTYCWAAELKDRGVRVNAVSPMAVTAIASADLPDHPPPEANAPIVLYLLSERAKNVTGQVVRSHGRQLCLMSHPAIKAPVLERDGGWWTIDGVAEAFDRTLAPHLLPTGLAVYEIAKVTEKPSALIRPT